MQNFDALVVGAMELAQTPLSPDELRAFLPKDHIFLELWPQVAGMTILHPLQALNIVERLDAVLQQPGDIIECGVFRGVTSILIAKLLELRQSGKKLFLFDSFQGLPEPDRQVDASQRFQKGAWAASRQEVEALLARHGVLQRCVIFEGWFSATLPRLDASQRFCFAYIDADLHASTVDCLQHLWKRMDPNAVAVFDDYHHPSGGVRKAVDDWVRASGELVHFGPASQCFVIRGSSAGDAFDYLRGNRLVHALVKRRLERLRALESRLNEYAGLLGGRA
jgi:predicted O-methyltransferase YrrM